MLISIAWMSMAALVAAVAALLQSSPQPFGPMGWVATSKVRAEHAEVLDTSTSLAGPDVNSDGVPDDIEAYVGRLPHTLAQKRALVQLGRAFRLTALVDVARTDDLQQASRRLSDAVSCVWRVFDRSRAQPAIDEIRDASINTWSRRKAYAGFDTALGRKLLALDPVLLCD